MERPEKKGLENAGSDGVLAKLGGKNPGLPFFAFLDAKGEMIVNSKKAGNNIGHPFQPDEIAWFMTMLDKAAPKMSANERGTIESWLKNQKK